MGDSEQTQATKRQRKSDDGSGSPGIQAAQAFLGSTPLSMVANKHQKVLMLCASFHVLCNDAGTSISAYP